MSNGPLPPPTAKYVTWSLPDARSSASWWNAVGLNTTQVSQVTVTYTDRGDSGNDLQATCYQNEYGVLPGDRTQYPSTVAAGNTS